MTLKVRDEEDVLEANLRYHLAQGVDFVVALDNGSADRTPEILGRYREAGLLHVIEEPARRFGELQGRWVTDLARLAAREFGAQWVINNDADEFWWPVEATLGNVFAAIGPQYGVLAAPRPEFLPRLEEDGSFVERLTIREARARSIPKLAHRGDPEIVLAQGSHQVKAWSGGKLGAGKRAGARAADRPYSRPAEDFAFLPAPRWPVRILHFPYRSYAQFQRRIERFALGNGYPDLARRRELREIYEQGRLPDLWRQIVPDEATVQEGLRDGRFVADSSLRDFLAGCPDPLGEGGLEAARRYAADRAAHVDAESRQAELADLALSMMEAQRREVVRRKRTLRSRVRKAEKRAEKEIRRAARRSSGES